MWKELGIGFLKIIKGDLPVLRRVRYLLVEKHLTRLHDRQQ